MRTESRFRRRSTVAAGPWSGSIRHAWLRLGPYALDASGRHSSLARLPWRCRVTPLPLALLMLLSPPVRACDLAEQRAALVRRATIAPSAGVVTSVIPALFAPQGFLLAPGPISARGPASVARILERDSLNATSRLRVHTIGGDVSRDGNDGFTYGYFDTFRANGDSVNRLVSRVLATRRRRVENARARAPAASAG